MRFAWMLVFTAALGGCSVSPSRQLSQVSALSTLGKEDREVKLRALLGDELSRAAIDYDSRCSSGQFVAALANDLYFFVPRIEHVGLSQASILGSYYGISGAYDMEVIMERNGAAGHWVIRSLPRIEDPRRVFGRTRQSVIIDGDSNRIGDINDPARKYANPVESFVASSYSVGR